VIIVFDVWIAVCTEKRDRSVDDRWCVSTAVILRNAEVFVVFSVRDVVTENRLIENV
jgi:hypothetical protein